MNLISSDLRQRPAWTKVATQLLHQPGGRWQETKLENNDITLMTPSENSYTVLRLLLYSAVDVSNPGSMQRVGKLHDFYRSDRSQVSEAKIVYALETGSTDETVDGGGEGSEQQEGKYSKEKGLEGYMKLQIHLLSTPTTPSSFSSIPVLPISHPSDLPSLLISLQQPLFPPSPTPIPAPSSAYNRPPNHHVDPIRSPQSPYTRYIPSRDTLLPLCTIPSRNQPFKPLSPHSVAFLSGPIFINFPGLPDLLELVETDEGKGQIRNAMIRALGDSRELGELARVEMERFLAFWEHEFGV